MTPTKEGIDTAKMFTKGGGGSKFEKSELKAKKKFNFEEERTTTECKGTRGPPGVWNAIVCVRSSPSIETPVLPFLFARAQRGTLRVSREKIKALWRTIQKKKCGERNKCTPRYKRTLEATAKAWDSWPRFAFRSLFRVLSFFDACFLCGVTKERARRGVK